MIPCSEAENDLAKKEEGSSEDDGDSDSKDEEDDDSLLRGRERLGQERGRIQRR